MAHRRNDSVSMDFLRALVGQFGPNFTVQSDVGLWRHSGSLAELNLKQCLLVPVIFSSVMKYFEIPFTNYVHKINPIVLIFRSKYKFARKDLLPLYSFSNLTLTLFFRESKILQFLRKNAKIAHRQCRNYGNYLSYIFDKNCVKATVLLKH